MSGRTAAETAEAAGEAEVVIQEHKEDQDAAGTVTSWMRKQEPLSLLA